jgi:hypothetical protein
MNIHTKSMIVAVVTAFALFATKARAELIEEKIDVKLSAPVMVPGKVLPAGTYIFEALKDARITRILSADESRIYATLIVPAQRFDPPAKATVTLGRGPEGEPQRIDSWFFPGDSIGNQFVYPKEHASKIADTIPRGVRDLAVAPEFLAVHAAHLGVHAGNAVVHAGKMLL